MELVRCTLSALVLSKVTLDAKSGTVRVQPSSAVVCGYIVDFAVKNAPDDIRSVSKTCNNE